VNLGFFTVAFNDPGLINTYGKKLTAVTKEQVRQVMKDFLVETNRSVVTTVPKSRAAAGGAQ
jgi:predicted Zn-dependent peptidase